MSKTRGVDRWKLGIIFLAALIRIYRLDSLTEFLGDQGRTMLVMRRFFEEGIIPLSGPSTLSGHNLGPMFYYLLAPGYMVSHTPLGVALWMAILGVLSVVVLYKTVTMMFGVVPARVVSLLWAVSPAIITADRTIWEPNLVPLWSLLFVYLLYRAYRMWDLTVWFACGVSVGILIQLHYPNIFFIGLWGAALIGAGLFRGRRFGEILVAGVWSILGFCVALLPFLWYEYTVGFRDISGVAAIIASGSGTPPGKRAVVWQILDYSYRVLGRMLPEMSRIPAAVVVFLWASFTLLRPTLKNIFFFVWFAGGVIAMVRYSGVVHDHYLYFLIPAPFLALGGVLASLRSHWRKIVIGVVVVLVIAQFMRIDISAYGARDLWQVSNAVHQIQTDSGGSDFSFTVIGSRSFSDMHYRYYMKAMGLTPSPVSDSGYKKLYVVCESMRCPTVTALTSMTKLPVLCYDDHCHDNYPDIALWDDWSYVRHERVSSGYRTMGKLYIFERRGER